MLLFSTTLELVFNIVKINQSLQITNFLVRMSHQTHSSTLKYMRLKVKFTGTFRKLRIFKNAHQVELIQFGNNAIQN